MSLLVAIVPPAGANQIVYRGVPSGVPLTGVPPTGGPPTWVPTTGVPPTGARPYVLRSSSRPGPKPRTEGQVLRRTPAGLPYSGAAYVVLGPVTGSYDLGDAAGKFSAASGAAGVSVANAGDVDADGLTDLLIGAYGESDAAEHAGAAYPLLGSGTFLSDVRASE